MSVNVQALADLLRRQRRVNVWVQHPGRWPDAHARLTRDGADFVILKALDQAHLSVLTAAVPDDPRTVTVDVTSSAPALLLAHVKRYGAGSVYASDGWAAACRVTG